MPVPYGRPISGSVRMSHWGHDRLAVDSEAMWLGDEK